MNGRINQEEITIFITLCNFIVLMLSLSLIYVQILNKDILQEK